MRQYNYILSSHKSSTYQLGEDQSVRYVGVEADEVGGRWRISLFDADSRVKPRVRVLVFLGVGTGSPGDGLPK